MQRFVIVLCLAFPSSHFASDVSKTKQALQQFNHLIGSWRGTGQPDRSRMQDFWQESIHWQWQFGKKDTLWLKVDFEKSKHFKEGELRYLPTKAMYQLTLQTLTKEKVTFTGKHEGRRLTLSRQDKAAKEDQQIVFTFLHSNRYLYRYETKPIDRSRFKKQYQVGATKKGVPFAGKGDSSPACVVSGGKGTIAVTYKGKTWYVCCSGCRAEFNENPEKYIKEFEAKQKRQ